MAKVIHKGKKENGEMDTEVISTPVLITKLIGNLSKLHEADIQKALEEIRSSSEQDERIRKIYAKVLKDYKHEQVKKETKENRYYKHEKEIILGGIEAMKKCILTHHDMRSAYAIGRLCKAIAGSRFSAEIQTDDGEAIDLAPEGR